MVVVSEIPGSAMMREYHVAFCERLGCNARSTHHTDQGCQFTSKSFTSILIENGIKISMDHKGRCFDNIFIERLWRSLKYEAVYYCRPETIKDLELCLDNYVLWYNNERLHQSLDYEIPKKVYFDMVI